MKRFSEQFHKQAQLCKLTATERADVRDRLVSYMEYHPLPIADRKADTTIIRSAVGTETFRTYPLPWFSILKGVVSLTAVLFVIIPILAERAVPGDTLYAIKIGLTEEVRSTLTFTPTQRVVWETARLNRRIAEAQLLESKGELTEAVEADVAAAVKTHTDNAQREIAALRIVDTDEAVLVELELTTTLGVHLDALRNRTTNASVHSTSTASDTSNMILSALTEAQLSGKEVTSSTSVPAYEKLVARVEQHTTRLYEVVSAIENTSTPEQLQEARRRISDIERAIATAFALSEQDKPQAQVALMTILQRSQRLLVYLTNLEVRTQVALESIAPMDLTAEEETFKINTLTTTLDELVARLSVASTTNTPQADKVVFALDQIKDIQETIASSTTEYAASATIGALESAIAIAEAAEGILDRFEITTPVDVLPTESSTTTSTSTPSTATTTDEQAEPAVEFQEASSTVSTDEELTQDSENI